MIIDLSDWYSLQERLELTRLALRRRCKQQTNWYFLASRLWRWAFTAKAVACLWFGREVGDAYLRDGVEVAFFDFYSPADYEYGGCGWSVLVVCVERWRFQVSSDSSV